MENIRFILIFILSFVLSSCWPTSISFVDSGSMPEEWKTFSVKTLDLNAPNAPISYAPNLTESIKDGIQNNTRLLLNSNQNSGEILIEGSVSRYDVTPLAVQPGATAAYNRLNISVNFTIFTTKPEEDQMILTSSRFADFDVNTDFSSVESDLIEEINKQIIQDVINKLYSNW